MTTGIIYLLTSMELAARLVVSLYSLRQYYGGPITVFTTRAESHAIGELCQADARLRVDVQRFRERRGVGYQSSYLTKTAILRACPYDHALFLDADTLVAASIDELLVATRNSTIVATNFCGFVTTEDPTRAIIESWRSITGSEAVRSDVAGMVDLALAFPQPAVNVGVFGIRSGSPFLKQWDRLTLIGRITRTPEETALQLLLPRTDYSLFDDYFNRHPFISPDRTAVRIWHFAARVHLHPTHGAPIWLPEYENCLRLDVAQISKWSRLAGLGDPPPIDSPSRMLHPADQSEEA